MALAKQDAFRARVQDEHVVGLDWSTPELLAASVQSAVYNWQASHETRSASPESVPGRIITFYSYKGGTGRTMALANVAWILATRGKRVLTIDWDLEAPGLHRYFAPFIEDKEIVNSPVLIDFLNDFVEGARTHSASTSKGWFESYAHLTRYASSLNWDFLGTGTVDFVPAGRQGPSYGISVTTFNWGEFHEKLGGGVFLEAVKRNLRAEYDYILIDSRTGISDASGICTIQMPDDLVVCFTLNGQSIKGASAIAESAFQQRFTPARAPGIRVWPVPTRVELAERDRLERARAEMRTRFQKFLHHLAAKDRHEYWGSVEVLYQPYFAYEEVLAVLAERRQQTGSLLQAFEQLTSYLTDRTVTLLGDIDEERRRIAVSPYAEVGPFYLSYSHRDVEHAATLAAALRDNFGAEAVLWDRGLLKAGDAWAQTLSAAMNRAQAILILLSPNYMTGTHSVREAAYVAARGLRVVPILLPGTSWGDVESHGGALMPLRNLQGFAFSGVPGAALSEDDVARLIAFLRDSAYRPSGPLPRTNPDDPHQGQFGGQRQQDGFTLTGTVTTLRNDWFEVELRVERLMPPGGDVGEVEFHLHPTFNPPIRRVAAAHGPAILKLEAWGAFTVGAIVIETLTKLELDLSQISDAPVVFASR